MNAREAMLALLDGKMLYHHTPGMDVKYRLNEDDMIEQITEGDIRTNVALNWIDGIVEQCPLTFREAMQEAIKGRKISCENTPNCEFYFNEHGALECSAIHQSISSMELKGKWRVVE